MVPRGTDLNFLEKVGSHFGGHKQFRVPKTKFKSDTKSFVVVHYAGEVCCVSCQYLTRFSVDSLSADGKIKFHPSKTKLVSRN
jgi:myosin heavy subunit